MLGWWEVGQQALPSSYQYFPPVFFVILFYFKHSSKIPFPPLQMTHLRTGLCEICSAFSHAVSSFPFFRKLSRGQRPLPYPQPLGPSLIPLLRPWYPLLPPAFCCFGMVFIPQQSHKFSHLCLQDTFLNSKMWIIRIKRDEICTEPGTEPGLQPKLGTQLRSANTC